MKNLNNYEVMFITNWKYSKPLKEQQSFNFIISWLWYLINISNFLSILYKKLNFKYKFSKKYIIKNIVFWNNEYIDIIKKYNTVFWDILENEENYIVNIIWLNYIPIKKDYWYWYTSFEMIKNIKNKPLLLIVNKTNLLFIKHILDIIYSKQQINDQYIKYVKSINPIKKQLTIYRNKKNQISSFYIWFFFKNYYIYNIIQINNTKIWIYLKEFSEEK